MTGQHYGYADGSPYDHYGDRMGAADGPDLAAQLSPEPPVERRDHPRMRRWAHMLVDLRHRRG